MKKPLLALMGCLLLCLQAIAQQTYSLTDINCEVYTNNFNKGAREVTEGVQFGVGGLGSLSAEQLEKANGAGKLSFFLNVPFPKSDLQNVTNISFNKNATNRGDTLLPSTLLFPELGNVSFNASTEMIWKLTRTLIQNQLYLSTFFDFAAKDIRSTIKDSVLLPDTTYGFKENVYHFNTLSYTLGGRIMYLHFYTQDDKVKKAAASLALYFNAVNVPDEDNGDYRYIMADTTAPSVFWGFGIKPMVQLDNFIVFADMRHTYYNDTWKRINNRDLKGFAINIGFAITGTLFKF